MAARTSKVYVLYTGGTLGMVPRDPYNPSSPLVPADRHDLIRHLPKDLESTLKISFTLDSLVNLEGKPVQPIDSSDVTSDHWKYMANAIRKVYDSDYDGFVILHGTDTMAYTSSALSFMLANLAKPVVITGSQLPISHARTDAVSNFVNALHIAGYRTTGLPLIPEVIIVFAGAMLRGNRVRKMSSSAWQGFDTPNYPHLGTIGEHIRVASEYVLTPPNNESFPFFTRLDLERHIADVSLFPGIHPAQLRAVLCDAELRGAVLRTFGSGNAPSDPALLDVIDESVKSGKVIVNVTQCPEGMVEAGLYEASSGLLERGVISGLDLTPEAALTKLMSLLANEPAADVAAQMQLDLRGEQSASLFDLTFGATEVVAIAADGSETRAPRPDITRRDGAVTVAAHTAGQFHRAGLQSATIRLRGLRVDGLEPGQRFAIDAYINHPNAGATSSGDPRHAVRFELEAGEDSSALADVTSVARRVLEDGRAVQLTLVPSLLDDSASTSAGFPGVLHFDGAFLALFTR